MRQGCQAFEKVYIGENIERDFPWSGEIKRRDLVGFIVPLLRPPPQFSSMPSPPALEPQSDPPAASATLQILIDGSVDLLLAFLSLRSQGEGERVPERLFGELTLASAHLGFGIHAWPHPRTAAPAPMPPPRINGFGRACTGASAGRPTRHQTPRGCTTLRARQPQADAV